MQIRALISFAGVDPGTGQDIAPSAGSVLDVSDALAEELVRIGYAVVENDAPGETVAKTPKRRGQRVQEVDGDS